MDLSSLKFSCGLRKTILFLQERHFVRSRSSKGTHICANRKRGHDFLLVHNSNLGPILHRFGDLTGFVCSWTHPYSTLILGVFTLHQIAHVGRQPAHGPWAIWPWNYFRRIPTYWNTVPERYGQTGGQTDRRLTVTSPRSALASRGKNAAGRPGAAERCYWMTCVMWQTRSQPAAL